MDRFDWAKLSLEFARGDGGAARLAGLRRALENDPADAGLWNEIGKVHYACGRPREAEAAYRKALEIRPGCAEAWENLGWACDSLGRPSEAAAAFGKATERDPGCAGAWDRLSLLYLCAGRDVDAARAFRRLAEIGRDKADAQANLDVILERQRRSANS